MITKTGVPAMQTSEIDAELTRTNPWWRSPEDWVQQDVQLREARKAPFEYEPDPLRDLTSGGLYILRGPRRVGKSTAIKQLVRRLIEGGQDPRSILYASVEGRGATDLADLVRRGADHWLGGEAGGRVWLLDEITGVEGSWPAQVKRLRDTHPSFAHDTVVLTGSSAAQFDEAQKMLGGRRRAERSDRVLFQMPFVEWVRARGGDDLPPSPGLLPTELADPDQFDPAIDRLRPWIPDLVEHWHDYLRVGGYPQAVAADLREDQDRQPVLREALWDVIHGDAFGDARLTHTQTQAILRRLTASISSLLSARAVARDADISNRTAGKRLDALRRAFVAFPVHREQGLSPKPRSQSKWYFTDPALSRLAAERGAGTPPDRTALAEQQLGLALLRRLEAETPGAAIHHDRLLYYRSSSGTEIDFVAQDFAGTCVESKYVDDRWGQAFNTIAASGQSPGFVVTRSGLQTHDDGWAVPAGVFVYLIGS